MLQHHSILLLLAISAGTQNAPQPPAISVGRCSLDAARHMFNLRLIRPAEPGKVVNNRSEDISSLSNTFRTPSFSLLFKGKHCF